MNQGLRVLLATFTLYRLARLLAVDDGPLWVFAKLRGWTDQQRAKAQGSLGLSTLPALLWGSLDDSLRCSYCVGIWLALPVFLLYRFPGWFFDTLLVLGGITGGQAFLKSQERDQ